MTEASKTQTFDERPGFRVRLLGSFAVERDGVPIDTKRWQPRAAGLFKLLAAAPEHRRLRDDVIDLLWPDSPPEAAAGNLRIVTHRLRLALGPATVPLVLADHGWLALSPDCWWEIDLLEFERQVSNARDVLELEAALALYRGEPLLEERYEDWAIPIRERIVRVRRDACLRLADLYAPANRPDEAIRRLEDVLLVDPLDEEALRRLLTVLDGAGRRTEALRRFRQFEERLMDELAVSPSAETVAVANRLHEQFPAVGAENPPVGAGRPLPSPLLAPILSPDAASERAAPVVGTAKDRGRLILSGDGRPRRRVVEFGLPLLAALVITALVVHSRGSSHATTGAPLGQLSAAGSGPGQFHGPTGLGLDRHGNLYAADQGNDRVQEFSPAGMPLAGFGSLGTGPDQVDQPTYVAVGPAGNVFVADYGNRRIQVFLPDGHPLNTISRWSGVGKAASPEIFSSVAIDGRGHVYATDLFNDLVVKFRADGSPMAVWGRAGSGRGRMRAPTGIAVDSHGHVFVADRDNNRIDEFTGGGHFLAAWGGPGRAAARFRAPNAVAVDRAGNVYVADTGNNRIQKLSPSGRFLASWGHFGTGLGQFNQPAGVAVDGRGNIYVSDFFNNRVVKLSPTGAPLWQSRGREPLRAHSGA